GVPVDDRNDLGETPLHLACSRGLEKAAAFLCHAGADLQARDLESGWTPLHRSLYHGHVRTALLLLGCGAELGDREFDGSFGSGYGGNASGGGGVGCGGRERGEAAAGRESRGIFDHDGNTPLSLLSSELSDQLRQAATAAAGGEVFTFGKADFFLGYALPKAAEVVATPRRVDVLARCRVVAVAAGRHHSVALTAEGTVYT
ncbi:unnamed protein product, partial [Phaeothamnion confervicola]